MMLEFTLHVLNTNPHINHFTLPKLGINVSLPIVTNEKIRLSVW